MRLKHIEIGGFKSFAKKSSLSFTAPVTAVVGPNGSGKSNVVEAFRFVLGEQSMKSMRGKSGADLIFRGSDSSQKLSRASVSITFDNTDGVFAFEGADTRTPVVFDEVIFTREIYADGTSRYLMNGSEIRLKQIQELLSSVHIGNTSHHIISQGEADRILRASTKERREILEDALGLKLYHNRIRETQQRLAKTLDHLKEVQSLRREIAPHLTFLKKQVEKVEKAQSLRDELQKHLLDFFTSEKASLGEEDIRITDLFTHFHTQKKELETLLLSLPSYEQAGIPDTQKETLRKALSECARERRALEQEVHRLEGAREAHKSMYESEAEVLSAPYVVSFSSDEYSHLLKESEHILAHLLTAQTLEDLKELKERYRAFSVLLKQKEPQKKEEKKQDIQKEKIEELHKGIAQSMEALERVLEKEKSLTDELAALEQQERHSQQTFAEKMKQRYEVQSQIKDCDAQLLLLDEQKNQLSLRKGYYDAELQESAFVFGPSFLHTLSSYALSAPVMREDLRKSIEKLKIRLEEHSGIGNDVVKEYDETRERDLFLAREMGDIENSIANLESLVIDLKKTLDERFTSGVEIINAKFGDFFKTMFGGGSAFLSIVIEKRRKKRGEEDEEEAEEAIDEDDRFFERGIDVHVNLPSKKVKELQMLSGGERSLVSIALLFAISQVNPPPFLVLDETDAALDEANSRRYGDMVEKLSDLSQLIVVTHNRETMSRAGVLYGVTLGADGGSKLLSIKFDDAVKVAK